MKGLDDITGAVMDAPVNMHRPALDVSLNAKLSAD
jgi:hypothetical protein